MAIAATAMISQACNFQENKSTLALPGAALKTQQVSFEQVNQKVFTPSCNSCHAQQGEADFGNSATAFANLSQIDSEVFVKRSMPKGSGALNQEQLSLLRSWIDAGGPQTVTPPAGQNASNGSVTPVTPPSTPPVTPPVAPIEISQLSFEILNQKIFKPQCASCHNHGQGVDLTTYPNVKDSIAKVAIAALADKSMPPKKALSADDQALLSAWIDAGAPEGSPTTLQLLPNYDSINQQIFQPLCMNCHGVSRLQQRAPLQPYSALMHATAGKEKTPFVAINDSAHSVLIDVLQTHVEKNRMPPPGDTHLAPLPAATIDILKRWIDSGAPEKALTPATP